MASKKGTGATGDTESPRGKGPPKPHAYHHTHPFHGDDRKHAAAHKLGVEKQRRHAGIREERDGQMVDIEPPTPYEEIARERRQEYVAHLMSMGEADQGAFAEWIKKMVGRYGTRACKMHLNVLGWASAFMVQRYGEEVAHWPDSLTEADKARMAQMRSGPPRELGDITPLRWENGILQLPGGTVLHGLDEVGRL